MKQELHPHVKFILMNFVFVVVFGLKTFDSLFVEKSQDPESKEIVGEGFRNPASIPAKQLDPKGNRPLKNVQFQQEAITISINCKKNKKIMTQSAMIMLRGQYCFKDFNGNDVKLTNLKNGFEASFFAIEKDLFNTDLIQLSSGLNEIEVQVIKNQQVIYAEKIQIEAQISSQK